MCTGVSASACRGSPPASSTAAIASRPATFTPAIFFNRLGHVGMYIGRGKMIHAPNSRSTVRIESLRGLGRRLRRRPPARRRSRQLDGELAEDVTLGQTEAFALPPASSSTDTADLAANRHGRSAATTETIRHSESRKTTSIGKRMKCVCTELVPGRSSRSRRQLSHAHQARKREANEVAAATADELAVRA